MLGKLCLALAALAQINAYECNQQVAIASSGSYSQSYPVALTGSASADGGAFGDSSMSPVARNLVAKGKYPVALENSEHPSERQIPIITSQVTTPVQEKPTVRLPYTIPQGKTLSHTCTCYKTIMKPRVHQQIISVPSVQRYIETSHRPVIDSVHYEAVPVGYDGSSDASSQYQTSSSFNPSVYQFQPLSQAQAIQVPQVQAVQVPQIESVQIPQIQSVQVPQFQAVEVPQYQSVQVPQIQSFQVPQYQAVQVPEVRTVEVPQYQSVQVPQYQSVQVPQVQAVEMPSVQAVEIAQVRGSGSAFRGSFQVPQYQTVESDQYDY